MLAIYVLELNYNVWKSKIHNYISLLRWKYTFKSSLSRITQKEKKEKKDVHHLNDYDISDQCKISTVYFCQKNVMLFC